ncbi:MAG: zinc-ribbon domain-containing protein [Lachnospiraceae bacterium]|nr:zinc-ribbon domain-containing protein [Lachnospiraceae bacterium]
MSICPNCGRENPDGNRFCESCGADMGTMRGGPVPNYTNSAETVSGGYSYNSGPYGGGPQGYYNGGNMNMPSQGDDGATVCILSMVFGIMSFGIQCCYLIPIAAIVLGIIGLSKNSGSHKGFAIAGIICGSLAAVAWFIVDIILAIPTMGMSFLF